MQTRLHHLDALRATAMLLGIVLHASLAYTGGPWIVRDDARGSFAAIFLAIHGFRMQLFFLLSGFFTALLWRRYGLAGMLRHRAARIALPLLIGMFTIVPAGWVVVNWAGAAQTFDGSMVTSATSAVTSTATSVATSSSASAATSSAVPERAHAPHPVAAVIWVLFRFPFFQHLWFLWFLCWMVAGFALVAWCAERGIGARLLATLHKRGPLVRTFVASAGALVWLVPLTALTFVVMDAMKAGPGFGADTSASLLPLPGVLLHYAVFFLVGALLFEIPDALHGFSRRWIIALVGAAVVFPIAVGFAMGAPWSHALVPVPVAHRGIAALGQALYAWLACIALLGLFARFVRHEWPVGRYLSDSAYWLYLAHLPLVIAGQILLRALPWPPLVKFVVLVVGSTAILLASYEWCVRRTWIGAMLNGRRVGRRAT
ncbi:MAG: acyltransferase family protein [bacterium]